jgi:hypothetical protein
MKYIGQTRCTFRACYSEHVQTIRTNKVNSKYTQHILDTQHTCGSTENTMTILHMATKGRYMNTLEKCHIYITLTKRYSD